MSFLNRVLARLFKIYPMNKIWSLIQENMTESKLQVG